MKDIVTTQLYLSGFSSSCRVVWFPQTQFFIVWNLHIPVKKPMDKTLVKEIQEGRQKEKGDKQLKRTINLKTTIDWITQIATKKCVRTQFVTIYISTSIREVHDRFHQNFQIGLQINLHRYRGMSFKCTTWFSTKG